MRCTEWEFFSPVGSSCHISAGPSYPESLNMSDPRETFPISVEPLGMPALFRIGGIRSSITTVSCHLLGSNPFMS